MDHPEPVGEDSVEAAYAIAAKDMLAGSSNSEVVEKLVARGLDADSAREVVDALDRSMVRDCRIAARRQIICGTLLCVAGSSATVYVFNAMNSESGVTYLIAWGTILLGTIQLIRGVILLRIGR